MSGAVYICCGRDRCVKHNRELDGYPCNECQEEWWAANPATAAAIASGKGSAVVAAARKADRERVADA